MPLTRLDNLLSSKTGKYLYVSPDDFNATDALDNRGNSQLRPFVSIQRAFLEAARFSYLPNVDNDRFDQFTIMLAPGTHYIDNRPGIANVSDLPVFQYNQLSEEWETNSNVSFNLSDPNNILYKFNGRAGGATIPRGTSLVGSDLRRTQLRPLYVPDPADKDIERTSMFNVTGGCYFWQFTILDGDLQSSSPLYDTQNFIGKVYTQPNDNTNLAVPQFSHHKITNFVYADKEDLGLLYRKIARVFSDYQPSIDDVYVEGSTLPVTDAWTSTQNYVTGDKVIYNGDAYLAASASTNIIPIGSSQWTRLVVRGRELEFRVQENRIVGPLQDAVRLDFIKVFDSSPSGQLTLTVRTKINHGFFPGQYVAITNNDLNVALNGVFPVYTISQTDPKEFTFIVPTTATGLGLISGTTYTSNTVPSIGTNATVQAEIDSVESASPYIFNVSIRSTWGICGIWADGRKATGFKSMVIAQYTGVSLQKDDRAFIRYDEFSNTWNQAPLTDAFATTPYHIKGDAYWKDDWRNFHVKASDDSFIQCVSIFAVGFADHFLMESGGDMSITNSNSNFGNTSLHAIGYKGFSFNQDKGGYISDIVPPKALTSLKTTKQQYYTIDAQLSRASSNLSRLYLGSEDARNAEDRPSASVNGYRIGAKRNEQIYVKLDTSPAKSAELSPSGFKIWTAALTTLNPTGATFTTAYNLAQDAANLIAANQTFIQAEAFGYVIDKYPALRNVPYVNPNISEETARYRDASSLINLNRQEIIDRAAAEIAVQHPNFIYPGNTVSTNGNRFKDAYRLIQLNKTAIIDTAYAASGGSIPADTAGVKCKRDIGIFIDAVSLDVVQGGGNVYSRKFIQQYFNAAGTSWITGSLQGEETQSNLAFNSARAEMKKAINNQLSIKDLTITADPATGSNTSTASCADVQSAIDTLTAIITDRISAGNLTALPGETSAIISSGEDKCKRDIGIIVDAIAQDLFDGGNSNIIDATKTYFNSAGVPLGNGLSGEETQSITAFNKSRDWAKKAITNQLFFKDLTILADPVTGSNTSPNSCANVQITIDTLSNILTSAISAGNLNSLPQRNIGIWSQISDNSKCKRDIGYIIEAVVSDLRLGGNENTINAGESYYTGIPLNLDTTDGNPDGFTLDYIENEKNESIDAYNYVRNLAISSMRNHNTYLSGVSTTNGSSIVTVPSTIGLVIGMQVRSVIDIPIGTGSNASTNYNDTLEELVSGVIVPKSTNISSNIPANTYIKRIGDGLNGLLPNQIELGILGSKFDLGTTVNATTTSATVKLFVNFKRGVWSTALAPTIDLSVKQDYNYSTPGDVSTGSPGGECASIASSLVNYFTILSTIINNGINTVPRVPSILNTNSLAQRTTLFTLVETDSNGIVTSNPHGLETGTPVKLVPRAKAGVNVDKRVIRLPKGFDTNTKYYVISPGRKTDPFDYSTSIGFDGNNRQTLMLATSEENAAAGIYIYSSETDSIDSNVEIDVYQYLLDFSYDLYQYQTKLADGSSTQFETDRPHNFDIPANSIIPQQVFFRVGSDISGSSLPTLSSAFGGTTVSSKTEYYVRYANSKRFTIHQTFANARDNLNPVTFVAGSTAVFYTFASKKRSPLKYDPSVGTLQTDGCWYLETLSSTNTIIPRLKLSDFFTRAKTSDSYYQRIEDNRSSIDRLYRLRYVIPKNLKTVRDPLSGFVIKVRTDEKRRLLPQKIVLKPTAAGSSVATFNAPLTGERLGLSLAEQLVLNPDFTSTYDPSPQGNAKRVETNSKIAFTIQSARKVSSGGVDSLQLTVFDVGVDAEAYKTKIFTTVKISAPQGGSGSFVSSIPNTNSSNLISWSGYSSGTAYVHAYFSYAGQNYLILKDFGGNSTLDYNLSVPTVFTQGAVSASLLEEVNSGRNDLANNLYVIEGANVYTMTPGDTINDDNGVSYTISSVEDVSNLESSFYIFSIETIRRRIEGQQDGVYYLSCLKGDIRPYPIGSGVGENFRNFKFSQPVSKLYPEFYKNDPEWYKGIDLASATLLDPPPTISSADNYIHGLVTVNDSKNSITKEGILDLIADPGLKGNTFSGVNNIQAQPGSASAGSETRRIPISGDSIYPTENKFYVELRRPSIARSGNHTFEYLGFGPGNYSTGFPARQEVVLTDVQDFYAQAKRQDAGIVFYTGLNSNGDLYIGNRKINAITGEETFLERAILTETEDTSDPIATIATTFDIPVTFNDIITVNGLEGTAESTFNSPVVINNPTAFGTIPNFPSLKIVTGEGTNIGLDPKLEFNILGQRTGDIVLHQNEIYAAVYNVHSRGSQDYSIRTSISNVTPNTINIFGSDQTEQINFGSTKPVKSGDIIFKGSQTLFSGSLGWIYANDYIQITTKSGGGFVAQIIGVQGNATGTVIRLNYVVGVRNVDLGINSSSQVKISGATGTLSVANGVWKIYSITFGANNNFADLLINQNLPIYTAVPSPNVGWPVDQVNQPNIVIARSQTEFKEIGVLGAEAIRTETSAIGDYKLGVNTVARTAHTAYANGFVETGATDPRANLDVVGTAFISGKTLAISPNNYIANATLGARTFNSQDNALLVGGNSLNPGTAAATLRIATTDDSTPDGDGYQTGGRIGINTVLADLDRNLVIKGNARITGDFKFETDIDINGGGATNTADVRTSITTGTFNLLSNSGFTGTLNVGNWASTVKFADRAALLDIGNTAVNQTINIGNTGTGTHDVNIATAATSTTTLDVFNASTNVRVDIGNPSVSATSSKITLGGAYNANESNSFLEVRTKSAKFFGDIQIGTSKSGTDTVVLSTSAGSVNFFSTSGAASTISFGLNASELNIGGQGGTTTIRNSLTVDASVVSKGNITLDGGTATFAFNGTRAQLGSTIASHTGYPNNAPLDKNIDLVTIIGGFNNAIDTAGAGPWGGSFFQNAIGTYTDNSGAALVALTGNQFYLPLDSSPTYAEGDDILIDSTIATGVHPEIVKVAPGGLVRTTASPYYIIVVRQPYGTFLPQRTTHPDNTITRKVNVALDATWLTANTDGSGTTDLFTLAEFGGILANGDYIFVDRNTTGTTGEAVKIASSVGATAQKLIVTNGAGVTKFEVDSVTGATIVSDAISLGGLTVYGPLNFVGSCVSTTENRKFKLSNTSGETFSVDMCNGETTITQGILTTDVNAIDATATWNSAATTFTGIKLNVTNTASNDASKLIDLQTGGTTRFDVDASSGDTYLLGDLTVAGNNIKSSTNTALTLSGADVAVEGDLTVTGNDIKSSTGATVLTLSANDATFADNLTVTGDLTVNGGDFAVNSGGTERFNVNSNGAIDLGGITQYFTPTGGRKWIFVNVDANNDATAEPLTANTNYFVKPSGTGSNLILRLPTGQNGDVIRIVDVGGQIKYNCQLIVRAPTGINIQGDATGTSIGMASGTYGGGELIINTPNAAFGLVFVGTIDGNGNSISSSYRGWRLMEI